MTDSSDFGIGKKRKAEFALRDEEDDKDNKQTKPPESYIASEEELKKRRIVKVIRGSSNTDTDSGPKGRFTFLNNPSNLETNISQDNKSTDINTQGSFKKINVTTSTIRLNKQTPNKEQPIAEIKNIKENNADIKEEQVNTVKSLKEENSPDTNKSTQAEIKQNKQTPNKSNNSEAVTIVFNHTNEEKKFNFTKEGEGSSTNPTDNQKQKTFPFTNVAAKSGFATNSMLNTNPFTAKDSGLGAGTTFNLNKNPFTLNTNPFSSSIATNINPFSTSNTSFTGANKSSFNFNLANAASNPNWNSDDEDEGDNVNPEEEIKISGDSTSKPVEIKTNPNLVKFLKINLEDLSEYNFEMKKYQSKGKGDISLELTRTDKDKVVGVCVFRNIALKILFQANILPNMTNINVNNKNFKHIIVIQKLFSINEATNKPEPKSVKLEFHLQNDFETFKEKFAKILEILEKNDLSIFPNKSEEENMSLPKKKQEIEVASGKKEKKE